MAKKKATEAYRIGSKYLSAKERVLVERTDTHSDAHWVCAVSHMKHNGG